MDLFTRLFILFWVVVMIAAVCGVILGARRKKP